MNSAIRSHDGATRAQAAAGGGNDLPAVAAENVQVVLSDGIFVHIGVHGGSNELGALAGQNGGGEHVVSQTVGQLGAHIGGGRGDEHQVGALGQGDVLHLVGEVAVEGVHHGAAAGELLKGEGGDKLGGVLGHHDLYLAVLLDQGRGQRSGLVGGNAAGDAQKNGFSL